MIIIERPQGPAMFALYVVPLVQDRGRGDAPNYYGATEATAADMAAAGYVPAVELEAALSELAALRGASR